MLGREWKWLAKGIGVWGGQTADMWGGGGGGFTSNIVPPLSEGALISIINIQVLCLKILIQQEG